MQYLNSKGMYQSGYNSGHSDSFKFPLYTIYIMCAKKSHLFFDWDQHKLMSKRSQRLFCFGTIFQNEANIILSHDLGLNLTKKSSTSSCQILDTVYCFKGKG